MQYIYSQFPVHPLTIGGFARLSQRFAMINGALALSMRNETPKSPSRLRSAQLTLWAAWPMISLRSDARCRGRPAAEPYALPAHKRFAHNNWTACRHCRPHGWYPCKWLAATPPGPAPIAGRMAGPADYTPSLRSVARSERDFTYFPNQRPRQPSPRLACGTGGVCR